MTGEVQRLLDEGVSRAEVAVFYRTNAQSRVLAGHARARGHPLPGDRRHEVLRARRDQGRDRVPDHARQPAGRRRVHPDRQLAAARDRLDLAVAACSRSPTRPGLRSGTRRPSPSRCRGSAAPRSRRCGGSWRRCTCCASGPSRSPPIAELLKEVLQETGYLEALEAERTIEAQGRLENLEELVNVAAEYDALSEADAARRGVAGGLPRAGRADLRRRRPQRRRGPGHADDAPQRQGPRVSDRVHDRMRGRGVPALARARRGRPGGGAPALLRRHHPRPARPVPDLRAHPQRVRRPQLRRAEPVHRRDPRRADRP